ncbi:hypothetical protein [Hungatella hathewayi]|uniref:hypothetical protein n=1 Tax=Hungatella hathewayi TaxID=154046 RepID=UPI003567CDD6
MDNNKFETDIDEYNEYDLLALDLFSEDNIVGNINRNHLNYDQYLITMKDMERDINNKVIKEFENEVKIMVFPYGKKETKYGQNVNLAVYVEEDKDFSCGATPLFGRKSIVTKTKNHSFIINGRCVEGQFVSMVNTMSDIAENREVSFHKEEIRSHDGQIRNLQFEIDGMIAVVMPLALSNQELYVPILITLYDKSTNELIVGSTQSYFKYENVKIGCRWYEDELLCYKL